MALEYQGPPLNYNPQERTYSCSACGAPVTETFLVVADGPVTHECPPALPHEPAPLPLKAQR